MPKLDRTGPKGEISCSGRKLEKCNNATDKEKLITLSKEMGKKSKCWWRPG
jgi:hypothetical protein